MTGFSQALQSHIERSGLKMSTIAKASGVDRTLLYKIMGGQRLPSGDDVLERLTSSLMLSPLQGAELLELYHIAKIGEDVYKRHRLVQAMIENFGFFQSGEAPAVTSPPPAWGSSETTVLQGNAAINACVRFVLEEAAARRERIRLVAQPDYPFLMQILASIGCTQPDLSVTHVIQLQNSDFERGSNRHNLEAVTETLPLTTAGFQYNLKFVYEQETSCLTILPNLILTERHAVCISEKYEYGTCFHSPDLLALYRTAFDKIAAEAEPLISRLTDPMQHMEYYERLYNGEKTNLYIFFPQPCFGTLYSPELIRQCVRPELPYREKVAELYIAQTQQLCGLLSPARQLVSYFSEEGLREFLQTGRVQEVPTEYYTPIPPEERLNVVKALYRATQEGWYRPYLVNPRNLRMPDNLTISAMSEEAVLLVYNHPVRGSFTLSLNERSISSSIYSFFTYMAESGLVLPQEKAISLLDGILKIPPKDEEKEKPER